MMLQNQDEKKLICIEALGGGGEREHDSYRQQCSFPFQH